MKKMLLAGLGYFAFVASVSAAQVCTGQTGVYGDVSLTRSGACSDYVPYDGLNAPGLISGTSTCSFSLSPPVSSSWVSVKVSNVDDFDQVGFSLNGASYTLVDGDIDTVSTPPDSAGSLAIIGNQVTSPSSEVAGAGTISFTNSAPSTISSIDLVKTGEGGIVFEVCFQDGPVVPTIDSVLPATGSTVGGTSVVITGSNFTGATAVAFAGNAATSFTVDSNSQITAVTPAGVVGAATVAVTTPGGTVSTGTFTYVQAAPDQIASVPTLSEWAMIVMASFMAMFAVGRIRRKSS